MEVSGSSSKVSGRGVSVVTQNLSIVSQSGRAGEVSILKDVTFATLRGEMTAIMGPSGSGKTTLLNMLAGRVSKKMLVSGRVFFNGRQYRSREVRDFSSYVMQEDRFLEYLTVRETLHFASQLRLKAWTKEQRAQRVTECLSDMGLMNCLDVLVGGSSVKGISGGQRKRVSIAIALLSNPQLLFLDEPTSGLDASLAYDVIKILDSITQTHGRTILCTIHQPRPQVFQLFDTLLLLRAGQTVYRGPAAEAVNYFGALGYQCPEHFNAPDFFLDLLAADDDAAIQRASEDGSFQRLDQDKLGDEITPLATPEHSTSIVRVVVSGEEASRFADAYANSDFARIQNELATELLAQPSDIAISADMTSHLGLKEWLRSVIVLVRRDLRNNWRNTTDFQVTVISSLLMALIFSTIWWQIPWPSTSLDECEQNKLLLRNILGGMIQPLGKTAFDSFDTALAVVKRRPLVNREAGAGMYTHSARFVSSAISDMSMVYAGAMLMAIISYWCFGLVASAARFFTFCVIMLVLKFSATSYAVLCGTVAKNTSVASALLPLGTVLFFFTSGLSLRDGDVPNWLTWLQNISYLRFLFQGLARDQFQNDEFLDVCAGFETPHGSWPNIGIAFAIACALRLLAFLAQCLMHKHVGLES